MLVPTLILLLTLIITPIVIPILITKLTLTLIIMVHTIDCIPSSSYYLLFVYHGTGSAILSRQSLKQSLVNVLINFSLLSVNITLHTETLIHALRGKSFSHVAAPYATVVLEGWHSEQQGKGCWVRYLGIWFRWGWCIAQSAVGWISGWSWACWAAPTKGN